MLLEFFSVNEVKLGSNTGPCHNVGATITS
jgi:hypothetical protein